MHDDRFYVAILLAHRLYEIRRGSVIKPQTKPQDLSLYKNLARKTTLYH